MTIIQHWAHDFAVDGSNPFFAYRGPEGWLYDLSAFAGMQGSEILSIDSITEGFSTTTALHIVGTDKGLRFVCAALNQQAEQTPNDPTPVHEGMRLEATLSGAPLDSKVVCPACGESRWKVDIDIALRTAIIVNGPDSRVLIDRLGSDPEMHSDNLGGVECAACAMPLREGDEDDEPSLEAVLGQAQGVLAVTELEWEVMTDYRQI